MSSETDCEVVPVTILGKTENYCRTHKKDIKGEACQVGPSYAEPVAAKAPKAVTATEALKMLQEARTIYWDLGQ